ncbi:YadA-like family protein [Brevundimonas pishanensis]|uniref:YadA-like family protein n=1 Tax=Brevundimonas pishanensis TaxID=2896315 RepID=UPI001FA72AA2|nr:YadA-like family protein [Brevundimonas pishanensis]
MASSTTLKVYWAGTGVTGNYNIATGNGAGAYVNGNSNIAIGNRAGTLASSVESPLNAQPILVNTTPLNVTDTVALGSQSVSTVNQGVAVGTRARVDGTNGLAFGADARSTEARSIAMGDGATTSAVVGTANTTIGGNTYAFAGTAPVGTFSIGSAGNERTLTNLAAGRIDAASTDAVNGSQLFATNQVLQNLTAASGTARYVSINDAGTPKGNVNSDGATGADAVAIGPNVTAIGNESTSIGSNNSADGNNSLSIGTGNQANGTQSQAIGDDNEAVGEYAKAFGTSNLAYGERSMAMGGENITEGAYSQAIGYQNYTSTEYSQAIGANNQVDGERAQAMGIANLASGNFSQAYGADNETSGENSQAFGNNNLASGNQSQAIGLNNTASADNSQAVGENNQATGNYSQAFGADNVASGNYASVYGANSTATADRSMAFGYNAQATHADSIALGSNASTSAAAGTASTTLQGTTYNFAGTAPVGTVSIGSAGNERTITNVAAGRLDANSTDAVNGSQLHATNQALNTLSSTTGAGWNISADGANATAVGTASATGNSIDLSNTDGNIVVGKTATSNDVTFDLADDVTIGNSLTVGSTVVDGSGITTNALNVGPNFTVDSTGAKYTGPITDGSHIANKDYVDNTVAAAASDIGVNFTGNDGGVVRRTNGQTLSIRGDASTAGNYDAGNIRTATDASTGEVIVQMASAPRFGNVVINDGESGRITGVTDGVLSQTSNHAVNGSQLVALGDQLAAAFSSTSTYDPATNTFSAQIAVGDTVYNNVQDALRAAISSSNNGGNNGSGGSTNPEPSFVVPGGYAQFIPGENIVKTQSADGVTVSVNRNMTNLESISIANGPTINQNGINMNGDRITNLADGVDPMDAVNVRQLNAGLSNTLLQANNYTDTAINRLGGQLEDYRRDANGGTAAAMAMSTIPQAQEPGANMVGMGVSTWGNEQALAVGYSRYTTDGRFVLRATGTYNTRSQGGAAVGVGFQF